MGYFIDKQVMESIDRRNATKQRMALGGIGSMQEAYQLQLKVDPNFVKAVKKFKEEFRNGEKIS